MAEYFLNPDSTIRPFTDAEVDEIEIETLGIRDGSHPTFARETESNTVQAEYLINSNYFERFVTFMLGASDTYLDDMGVQRLTRLMPQTWPRKPQFAAVKIPQAIGHQFTSDDNTGDFPVPQNTRMKVKVLFQHLPFDLLDDADTTRETLRYLQTLPSQHSVDYLNLPGGVMQYILPGAAPTPPHGNAIPYNIGFPVPMSTISQKWIRLPRKVWGSSYTPLFRRVFGNQTTGDKPYVGTTNKTAFLGYPAGCLLYLGVEEELQLDPLGDSQCWNLTHKWLVSYLAPHTWKYFFSVKAADAGVRGWYFSAAAGSTYAAPGSVPDNTALFNEREHADLFLVG